VKITHVSTFDLLGGAARAAYRLHSCLCQLGYQSRFFAQYKTSKDPTVTQFTASAKPQVRLRRGLKRRYLALSQRAIGSLSPDSTFFNDDRSQHNGDALTQLPESDVLNLHWVAGFIDYREFFQQLPPGLKVVWTMHDMNPFTGGCHYDAGCQRYRQKCGMCPQLRSTSPKDFSAQVWSRKMKAFSTSAAECMHLVAPSRWLAGEARQSTLFSEFKVSVIPNGIDTDLFQPRDKRQAKEQLKIPQESSVVLFVAETISGQRKGFSLLAEALRSLKDTPHLYFLAVGHGASSVDLGPRIITLDYIEDENRLSLAYCAADVFVVPSLQDNLPNTALEALSCGVPTVAFDVGGLRDIIREGQTGHLVPASDVHALRTAIAGLLENNEQRAMMAGECRRRALAEYRLDIQASRYAALYKRLIQEECSAAERD
jgi:glycosyltransferase involved in cell wall biosynthesis